MKRRVVSVDFLWRFVAYAALGSVIATALVFIADSISPALGDASGKWALLVAIFGAWHAARELPPEEVEKWKAENPEPEVPKRYYYRKGEGGDIHGPDSLQAIRGLTSGLLGVEIVEATGQSERALKRAIWAKLAPESQSQPEQLASF